MVESVGPVPSSICSGLSLQERRFVSVLLVISVFLSPPLLRVTKVSPVQGLCDILFRHWDHHVTGFKVDFTTGKAPDL